MKISAFFSFCFFPGFLTAQVMDTAAVEMKVDSLVQVCKNLEDQNKYEEALFVIEEAQNLSERTFGKKSAKYASCLFIHGRVFYFMRRLPEAELVYLEVKNIREQVLGKDHVDYAYCLNNLGSIYAEMGQYDKTLSIFLETKAIYEKTLEKEHTDYLGCLNNLVEIYKIMGQHDKAIPILIEKKAILENKFGKKHLKYAYCLQDLGVLYRHTSQYEKAEPLLLEAKVIKENELGKNNYSYASILGSLGTFYAILGQYEKAESFLLESKEIEEKEFGKNDPILSSSLNNLGNLYALIGQYEKAEQMYLQDKSLGEKALGTETPEYALTLNNLGNIYFETGQYAKSERFYLEAKEIREKILGKDHIDYAASLNNLGSLYRNTGQNVISERLYLEARAIWGKAFGKDHPTYAECLNNLGSLYFYMGEYDKAMPLYLEAKSLLEKKLGKSHPDYTESVNNLALLYWKTGPIELAYRYFLEANSILQNHLVSATHHLSEPELASFGQLFTKDLDNFYSFSQKHITSFPDLVCKSYDNALFYKGFLLNVVSRVNNLAHADSAALEQYYLLKSYHRRLAAEYEKPIADREGVTELEEKANTQEKELTRMVAGYGEAVRQVNWQEVQAALKAGEAAIEFVHYRFNDPKPTDSTLYAALLLRRADTVPLFIPLFEEKLLLHILDYTGSDEDYVREIYRGKIPAAFKGKEHSLNELIWKPLEPYLQNIETIWYAPSGQLHRLAFAAIEDSAGRPISDRLRLHLLGSTRELVFRDDGKPAQINSALLFGDINYATDSTKIKEVTKKGCPSPVFNYRATELMFGAGKSNKRAAIAVSPFDSLPDTRSEIMFAAKKLSGINLSPLVITGADATEESFKCHTQHGRQSPGLVVVASHGAFLPDPKRDSSVRANATFRAHDNPMHRSMLVFAGADHAWTTGVGYDSLENGLLTAYEIAGLNLSNTKVVVLSACETGLGHINGAEGVYGLQRAFKIAGAQYLLMSLWRVPGKATADLMNAFYTHWLDEKKPIREAFYMAQQDMKSAGKPAYEWAGFVLFN